MQANRAGDRSSGLRALGPLKKRQTFARRLTPLSLVPRKLNYMRLCVRGVKMPQPGCRDYHGGSRPIHVPSSYLCLFQAFRYALRVDNPGNYVQPRCRHPVGKWPPSGSHYVLALLLNTSRKDT